MKRIKAKKRRQTGGATFPIDNTATKLPMVQPRGTPSPSNLRGGTWWGHRDPKKDSDLENALEYIPVLGNILSINDWMDSMQNLTQQPSWGNAGAATLETAGIIPFGKAFSSMGKGMGKKFVRKAATTGHFVDAGMNAASDERLHQTGGIVDPLGQWVHPGQITTIPGNDITMEGVDYPVLGVSDQGDRKLMKPGGRYKFKGKSVTEYPMAQSGGRPPIFTSNPKDPRLQAYNDSLNTYNNYDSRVKAIKKLDGKVSFDQFNNEINKLNKKYPLNEKLLGSAIPSMDVNLTDGHKVVDLFNTTKPVQPYAYRQKEQSITLPTQEGLLQDQKLEFNPVGFKKGSYFTREQQRQETGGKESFDTKTGKKLQTGGVKVLRTAQIGGKVVHLIEE